MKERKNWFKITEVLSPISLCRGTQTYVSEESCHIRHCAVCADIKEVETANLKGSVKQEDKSSCHPTENLDSTPSDIYSIAPPLPPTK
jgi:hypothetical protein